MIGSLIAAVLVAWGKKRVSREERERIVKVVKAMVGVRKQGRPISTS
jgi:hypothetical protein